MDYSLLVGISPLADGAPEPSLDRWVDPYGIPYFPGPHREVYFMGIIDALTRYGKRKQTAHGAKVLMHGVRPCVLE